MFFLRKNTMNLNQFFKGLLITLINYSLIFSYPVMAMGESNPLDTSSHAPQSEKETASNENANAETTKISENQERENNEESEEGEKDGEEGEAEESEGEVDDSDAILGDAKGDKWIALANAVVAGFLAGSIIKNCSKRTIDAKMAAAAGVTYLGSEIFTTREDKKIREDIEKDYVAEVQGEKREEEELSESELVTESSGDSTVIEEGEKKEENYEMTSAQEGGLRAQVRSYEKLEKTTKIKKGFFFASSGLFASAAGVASFKWMQESRAFSSCQRGLVQADTALPGVCASTTAVPDQCEAAALSCKTILIAMKAKILKFNEAHNQANSFSQVKAARLDAFYAQAGTEFESCMGHVTVASVARKASVPCYGYLEKLKDNLMVCRSSADKKDDDKSDKKSLKDGKENGDDIKDQTSGEGNKSLNGKDDAIDDADSIIFKEDFKEKKIFSWMGKMKGTLKDIALKGINFLLPKVNAFIGGFEGLMDNMGIVGTGAGVFISSMSSMKNRFDKLISTPRNRAIIWGAMAGVMSVAGYFAHETEVEMKENASEIQRILNAYLAKAKEVHDLVLQKEDRVVENQDISEEGATRPINLGDEEGSGVPCLTIQNNEGQCASVETLNSDEQRELRSIDPGLSNFAQKGEKIGNGVNNTNTISAGTLDNASDLSSQRAFAFKRNRQIRKVALNNIGKTSPRAVANFENDEKGFKQFVSRSTRNAFRKHGISPGSIQTSYGNGGASLQENTQSKGGKSSQSGGAGGSNQKIKGKWPSSFGSGNKFKGKGLDFGDSEYGRKKSKGKKKKRRKKVKYSQKKILEMGGINKNSNSNIFKTIHIRYKKTMYPIIFSE